MITTDGTQSTRLSATVSGWAWLIEAFFTSGAQRWTTWPGTITHAGNPYLGFGASTTVAPINESAAAAGERIVVTITVTNLAALALVLGNAAAYRGRRINLYLQPMNAALAQEGTAMLRWTGFMDKVAIKRQAGGLEGPSKGSIEIHCYKAGTAKSRARDRRRLTHAQQQISSPGDTGLEYIEALVNKPVTWLTKKFQTVS